MWSQRWGSQGTHKFREQNRRLHMISQHLSQLRAQYNQHCFSSISLNYEEKKINPYWSSNIYSSKSENRFLRNILLQSVIRGV